MGLMQLKHFAKPYRGMIAISMLLLFAQANAELALPDYLSNIVNVGIQQGGIEETAPVAIRESQMDEISLFMTSGIEYAVLSYYRLINESSPDYLDYKEKYPALENESIYVVRDLNKEDFQQLEDLMELPMIKVYFVESLLSNASQLEAYADMLPFNISMITPGMTIYEFLDLFSAQDLQLMGTAMTLQFEQLGDFMINQVAVQTVRAEYEALGTDMQGIQNSYMLRIGGWMILLTVASMVCTIGVGFYASRVATGMVRDIREAQFKKVEGFTNQEFDSFSTASLITRTTNDLTQVQMVIFMIMRMVFYAPIIGIGGIIRAINKAANMWWLIGLAVAVLVTVIFVVFRIALPKFKSIQKLTDRVNLVTRENLTGMMVIRAFNMQEFEEKRFEKANQDLTKVSLFINRLMVIMFPFIMLILSGLMVSITWIASHQIADANMQVGDMMAFMQYAMRIVFSFIMMSMMFIMLPRAAVSATRVAEVLETDILITDPESPLNFPEPFNGTIEFKNVCFRFPEAQEDAIHDISFTAKPGETTAILGSTGSGKSTLINLIPRFYDVCGGTIKINETDIRQVTQHDLRDKIGLVPQYNTLFSGTIESNLRYADENATSEVINSAIDIAQARKFVNSKVEGLGAEISQGGGNVSGGQKQRLSIARAIVKKPPIYILDDSFSALDFKTDAALRRAFKREIGGSTFLVVSQRVSTIMKAEQILVLDEGRLVGKGTHEELMKTCETYREIALSQNTEEELR